MKNGKWKMKNGGRDAKRHFAFFISRCPFFILRSSACLARLVIYAFANGFASASLGSATDAQRLRGARPGRHGPARISDHVLLATHRSVLATRHSLLYTSIFPLP